MALWQGLSTRMKTGGRRRLARKKRKYEIGREVILPTLGDESHRTIRTAGGNQKVRVLASDVVNVTDPSTGKTEKVEFKTVSDNPANPHYVRRNIVTKGAIVQTEKGKVRITSRPGQDGVLNGVLVE